LSGGKRNRKGAGIADVKNLQSTAPEPETRALAEALTNWYRRGHRDFPWRRTRDPWRILVSEVMLQQTRAQVVVDYYQRFLAAFPGPAELAQASDDRLLALWAGLGYYSRARNLREAARQIVALGQFPETLDGIRALKGVGGYTAAAVASIAFQLPHAVVDGNVLRVAARLLGDGSDIGAAATRQRFQSLLDGWIPPDSPADFNQAMMELGATVCLPRNPKCLVCPVHSHCRALAESRQQELPVKLRKAIATAEALEVCIVERGGKILMRKRESNSKRLAGFWELPQSGELAVSRAAVVGVLKHSIVNHSYTITVKSASLAKPVRGWQWIASSTLGDLPLTTISRKALRLWSVAG
jgi:A/G-specific adenine glycosylase